MAKNNSKILRADNFEWESVERKDYKENTSVYKDVHRYNLLGMKDDEKDLNFETRYFEVSEGGYTSFEYHRHPHSVIIIRGKGSVILGGENHSIKTHDVVYISPNTVHQFHADKNEPLGFICVVDRYRDRPTIPDDSYIQKHISNEETKNKIKR